MAQNETLPFPTSTYLEAVLPKLLMLLRKLGVVPENELLTPGDSNLLSCLTYATNDDYESAYAWTSPRAYNIHKYGSADFDALVNTVIDLSLERIS